MAQNTRAISALLLPFQAHAPSVAYVGGRRAAACLSLAVLVGVEVREKREHSPSGKSRENEVEGRQGGAR